MNKKIALISSYLDEILRDAACELNYSKDYELLIAVILSAQTTDKKVNSVTPDLFKKYPKLEDLSKAKLQDVEDIIHSIGLYKNKAKNIVTCAQELIKRHEGKVPSSFDDLTALSGVGRKTANVVRAELFQIPAIAVDTHVERVSKRLGLALENDDPYKIEVKIEKLFPKDIHIKIHHQLIHFGRYFCLARNPKCEECKLKTICKYYKLNKLK